MALVDTLAAKFEQRVAAHQKWSADEIRARSATLPDRLVKAYLHKRALSPEEQETIRAISDLDVKTNQVITTMRSMRIDPTGIEGPLSRIRQMMQKMHGPQQGTASKQADGLQARILPKTLAGLSQQYLQISQRLQNYPQLSKALQDMGHALQGQAQMVTQSLQQAPAAPQPRMQNSSIHVARLHLDRAIQASAKAGGHNLIWNKMVGSLQAARGVLMDLRKVQVEARRGRKKLPAIGHDPWAGKRPSFDSAYRKIDSARGQLSKLLSRISDGSLVTTDIRYALSMLEKTLEAMKRC